MIDNQLIDSIYKAIQGEYAYPGTGTLDEKITEKFPKYPKYKNVVKNINKQLTLPRAAGFAGLLQQINTQCKWVTFEYYTDDKRNELFFKMTHNKKEELLPEWENINLKTFKNKCIEGTKNFIQWYLEQREKDGYHCCYCGVREEDLAFYFNDNTPQYKEARQRGKLLEVERLITAPKEVNLYNADNCRLACYICNNAKSDFISPKDFKPIARAINEFWQCALKGETDISYLNNFDSNWAEFEEELKALKELDRFKEGILSFK